MVAKSKDPDWIPLTPEVKTDSNRRKKSTGKADTLLSKKGTRMKGGAPKLSKAKAAKSKADKKPKILKKRREVRKRMSLNKLVELTKVVRDIGKCACTALNLSWMNVKKERSNRSIKRKDFKSGFAAHVTGVQHESVEHVLEESDNYNYKVEDYVASCHGNTENLRAGCVVGSEMDVPDHSSKLNTCSQSEQDIIDKDKDFDIDASTEKMDCDGANTQDQNDCAATVINSDDLSSSFSTSPPVSEDVDRDGVNNSVILEAQQVVVNETKVMAAAELEENAVAWVPLTPQIQAEVGQSRRSCPANNHEGFESNISVSDSAKAAPKCGKSESFIDILKKMSTRGVNSDKKPHKRMKMKRHRPKVGPITPCTPKPRTPKPAKKATTRKPRKRTCRRKLDFGEECRAMSMSQEELMKPQDMAADGSSEPPKICKKRRGMRRRASPAKLNALIRWIREQLPPTPTKVQEEEVLMDNMISCNGSILLNAPVAKIPDLRENVLLIQGDEAVRDALADFVVKKMQSLCIDDETCNQLVVQDPKRCGAIVLAGEQKDYKPAVDLDQETMVVWNLLMGDDWNESAEAEALGADHEEYMKRERELLRNKLDVFLNRMHVVQGNRQFSPWKGSIVDSIVGVFLTQNVSDNLSSSAFIAFASRYPPLSVDEQNARIRLLDQQVMVVEPSSDKSEIGEKVENESIPEVTQGGKRKGKGKKKQELQINWDDLRKRYSHDVSRERTEHNADSVNWEAMRQASAAEVAQVIVERGMNNQLAGRIKGFLDRLVRDHGSIDLEWLRNVPPPKAKDYLLSISGLGLKSTECVRLLALHFPAFPVDTNAGRFFVRVGWVPLKKLPEGVKLHQLNQYPSLDSIQKYMWSRACDNDHPLLYETHCHSVTVAKSFCTKQQPNCEECPMRDECMHYASALASNKPRLQGSQPNSSQEASMLTNSNGDEAIHHSNSEPIIEFPPSPVAETAPMEPLDIGDMEDIGTLSALSRVERSKKIHSFMEEDDEISKALVAINPNVASFQLPTQKLEYRLRTVHEVCELPDSHPFLATFSNREHGDRCPYLLAIWTEDERSEEATTCDIGKSSLSREVVDYQKTSLLREVADYQKRIKGTILVPCFTANRGRFPLNGTYFQINEVFADHESSLRPIDVPRELIWNLRRRTLYCGTSITSICKGMNMVEVAYLFNRSFICIRGFDTKSRASKLLVNRFHLCKSRLSVN